MRHLDCHDAAQALAHVLPVEVAVAVPDELVLARQQVHRARQRKLHAVEVGASVNRANAVGVSQQGLRVGVRAPLHGHLHQHSIHLPCHRDGLRMKLGVLLVQVLDVLYQPTFVMEHLRLGRVCCLVCSGKLQADGGLGVQEGKLPQTRHVHVGVHHRLGEYLGVGKEAHAGAVGNSRGGGGLAELGDGDAAREPLLKGLAVSVHRHLQGLRQCVHHRDAHSVQAPRHPVPRVVAAELAAGVQHRQHSLQRGLAGAAVRVCGDAAAVVLHHNPPIALKFHLDCGSVSCLNLVNCVVHHLI
mmetsp:Transcript_39389/g.75460  ORF Transcript_39389/g.75460 Transcript_39389/m.75460 type:complete len:300 (-) Transcript_39389:655-1554(-)